MPDAPSRSAPAERIGVALCTYNGACYLQAQLDSILDQDLPVNEVMIGDDGSSDQTLQLLQAFVPRAQALGIRVEIVQHARNLGYVRNFADALMRCQADILFLCDQDDVWHAGRVRRYVQRFQADPALLLLHSDARLVDAQGAPLGQRLMEVLKVHLAEVELERDGLAADVILQRNFVTGATCALRRGLLAGSLPVPPGWSHDEWLAVHASLRGGLDMLAEPTIDYRQHGNNQVGANEGVGALLRRVKLMWSGWYATEVARIGRLVAPASDEVARVACSDGWRGHLALLPHIGSLRRRARDRVFLFVMIVLGVY